MQQGRVSWITWDASECGAVPGNISVLQSATNQAADKQTLVEGAELLSALPKGEGEVSSVFHFSFLCCTAGKASVTKAAWSPPSLVCSYTSSSSEEQTCFSQLLTQDLGEGRKTSWKHHARFSVWESGKHVALRSNLLTPFKCLLCIQHRFLQSDWGRLVLHLALLLNKLLLFVLRRSALHPTPKALNLTCFPWYSLNSTLENSESQTVKALVYWWNSFPFSSTSGFKALIHVVSVWSEYSSESVMVLDVGRRQKKTYCILLFCPFLQPSTCIPGCREFSWPSTWLDCCPLSSSVGCDRGFN